MANTVWLLLTQLYRRLNYFELFIVISIVICYLRPLVLPNTYSFGYKKIDLHSPQVKCDFLQFQESDDIFKESTRHKLNISIDSGGKYINKRCQTNQHVAIIVPYRNRSEHLKAFVHHIHPFLVQQNAINYQLFVIEQDDSLPFNRGNLLNIGYYEALQIDPSLNCFIFHDVDILPLNLRQLYTCSSTPRHLCSYLDKFRYVLIYPKLFGGVIAMQKDQYARANGYSNQYSGWGGEDDDFYERIHHHFGLIERYPEEVGRCVMLTHHQYEVINESRSQLLQNAITRSQTDGLSSLNTTYVRKQIEFTPMYVKIKVALK